MKMDNAGDAIEKLVTVIENQQMIRARASLALGFLRTDASDDTMKARDLLRAIEECASEATDFALKAQREIIHDC